MFCYVCSSPMAAQQRILSLWLLLLLLAALCPAANSKRGGSSKARGKSDGEKASPSQGRGLSKQGLKWAGAAAAGMLGGTGTGYGLGFFGKSKHKTGKHKTTSSEQQQQAHDQENQRNPNQSAWSAFVRGAAPAKSSNHFLTLGHVLAFLTAAWMREF
uniref:Shadow of prion protein 2 n=1 Tax=Iconisemion striatum TaxID=60296 RepID=A0A1A7W6S9_9TELE